MFLAVLLDLNKDQTLAVNIHLTNENYVNLLYILGSTSEFLQRV